MTRTTTSSTNARRQHLVAAWLGRLGCMVAALVAVSSTGCDTLKSLEGLGIDASKPTAQIERLQLQDLTLDGATLGIDVGISNPYSVPLPLADLDYVLASRGSQIVAGKADLAGSIPAGATKTVATSATFRFDDVLRALDGVSPGAVVPYSIDTNLSTEVPGIGPISIPLRKDGEMPIPRVPEVEITGIDWERLTLDEASAVMNVRVKNLNEFPIDLRKMSYGLALGGSTIGAATLRERASLSEGAEQSIEIPISFRPRDLGLAALSMLQGGGADYRLEGTMNVRTPFGAIDLPYDSAGETVFRR